MSKTVIKTVTKKYNAEGKMIEKITKTETVEDDAAIDSIGQVGITWQGDSTGGIGCMPPYKLVNYGYSLS